MRKQFHPGINVFKSALFRFPQFLFITTYNPVVSSNLDIYFSAVILILL